MILAFCIILTAIAIIGLSSARQSKSNEKDYYLASQSLSPWLAGLSAMATNNSGYMFIGLIGFTYSVGLSSIWLMVGWILGDFIVSKFIHKKINQQSQGVKVTTFAAMLGHWSGLGQSLIRFVALLSFIFLLIYASAQLVSGGKTLAVIFDWQLWSGIILGATIVILYTIVGGIRASIWTDAVQGIIMVFAMLILVVAALVSIGGINSAIDKWELIDGYLNVYPESVSNHNVLKILYPMSWLAAGMFVIGQPHIMVRFMAIKSEKLIDQARYHYYFWYVCFYSLAFLIGMLSRIYIDQKSTFDVELALPFMAVDLLPPFAVGVIIAGIFAATMSTADSLIINCSGNITQDLFGKKRFNSRQIKIITLCIALIVLLISLLNNASVFSIVVFAWTLLGISFTPILILLATGFRVRFNIFLAGISLAIGGYMVCEFFELNQTLYSGFLPFLLNLAFLFFAREKENKSLN